MRQSRYEISFVFSSSFTLAQLSSIFYRQLFMPKNSIGTSIGPLMLQVEGGSQLICLGRIPAAGYRQDRQSFQARAFLHYLNSKLSSYGCEQIRHSSNSVYGEFRWGDYKVDGATSTALYEVHGCWVHASYCCFKNKLREIHPLHGIRFSQVRYLDQVRLERLDLATCKMSPCPCMVAGCGAN